MRYGAYGVNYSPISRRKIFRRVFTRFAARFLAQAFFMLISFIFSYSEKFFRRVFSIFRAAAKWVRAACTIHPMLPYCKRIDLENAASPEEADKLEEMTADEIAVDGYYVVAGIARHEYQQGWKFLTLWDGYGLSEATWEPMSAFIQPDGSINTIFRSYLVENNERLLLTRAETLSQRKKKK